MEYTKVRLDFRYAEKGRFYRVVLVESDIDLENLGVLFVSALGGTMEHCFLYRASGISYMPREWTEEFCMEDDVAYEDYKLEDLPQNFYFEYDTGDGWDFACKKYKRKVTLDSIRPIIVLEGAGMGIWEDNIYSLYAYLRGEISLDFNGEDEERGIYKPWNFQIDKYSEFDDPLDIDALNDSLEFEDEYVDEYEETDDPDKILSTQGYEVFLRIRDELIKSVKAQLKELDYVKDVYDELLKHGNKKSAIEKIAKVLLLQTHKVVLGKQEFSDEEYKKELNYYCFRIFDSLC